jgi:hypothetical protein
MTIIATIEKFKTVTSQIELQLKGSGKYLFYREKECWNIFEGSMPQNSIMLEQSAFIPFYSADDFTLKLISHAIMENKRMEFHVAENSGAYSITSVQKAS